MSLPFNLSFPRLAVLEGPGGWFIFSPLPGFFSPHPVPIPLRRAVSDFFQFPVFETHHPPPPPSAIFLHARKRAVNSLSFLYPFSRLVFFLLFGR